jgi:hypothetical protein
MPTTSAKAAEAEVQYATEGSGPLLQRDYWGVIEGASCGPEGLARIVRATFERHAPPETALFHRAEGSEGPLCAGEELRVHITLLGPCRVRVVDHTPRSVTLRTLKGHPEAGRITFGSYRDEGGRLVFRIRSRTRAASRLKYAGFWLMGKQLQARCWISFIDSVARQCGGKIAGRIHVRTNPVEPQPGDGPGDDSPTFACRDGAH